MCRKTNVAFCHRGVPFPKPIQLKTLLPPLKFSKKKRKNNGNNNLLLWKAMLYCLLPPIFFVAESQLTEDEFFNQGPKSVASKIWQYCGRWARTVNILASRSHKKFKFHVWTPSISNYNLNLLLPCKNGYHGNRGVFWYLSFNKHLHKWNWIFTSRLGVSWQNPSFLPR